MSGKVTVEFAVEEGAVLRMIGLVERRGFLVHGIVMAEEGERASLAMDVKPRDRGRSLEVLGLQLRRLHGVRDVSFSTPATGAAS